MCGKNSGTTPNNILADGYPVGSTVQGSVTVDTMCVNCNSEKSDFQFSQLMIWNQALRYSITFTSSLYYFRDKEKTFATCLFV